ncbi:MAG: family 20 glycosylhydrolase, partial [Candidatus Hodarchaeota archaeon]
MKAVFLPKPKKIEKFSSATTFTLNSTLNVFVNKAKVQDYIMDFFGYLWRNFKINLKITPIRDRDFKDEYEKGFFMLVTGDDGISDEFFEEFMVKVDSCPDQGYYLKVTTEAISIISSSIMGFFNAVMTFQQAGHHFTAEMDEESKKISILIPEFDIHDYPDLKLRAVHLDLKHQLHSLDYLKDHLRLLAKFKINAVIWEWEDKFPFKKRPEIKHPLAFTSSETAELMELCQMYGIESIPLVQTYGHLEFVLKLDKYKHLNEDQDKPFDPNHTLDICALHDDTIPFLEDIISDVMSYHPRSRFFHIGGDEVYTIGTCEKCKEFVEKHGGGDDIKGKSKLYIQHVNKIIKIVKGYGKIPMIWHDYLLKYPTFLDELDKDVVIVYWRYGKDKEREDFTKEIQLFKDKGFNVLAANSVRSDFQFAIPTYSVRFQNIHELNKALVSRPENISGTMATSWAVCRAPMETTVPGLLFFAENSWNVIDAPYSSDNLKEFTLQALHSFFLVPEERIPRHLDIILSLEKCTVPPHATGDLEELKSLLNDSIGTWTDLMSDARKGQSVIENIIHGLRLQVLKVEIYQKVDMILGLLDEYGDDNADLPSIEDFKQLISDMDDFLRGFELSKYKTKELYEKLIYDEEVEVGLEIRFGRPAKFLDQLVDG